MSMPSGVAMNIRNASQMRLCWSAGQKNGYAVNSDT